MVADKADEDRRIRRHDDPVEETEDKGQPPERKLKNHHLLNREINKTLPKPAFGKLFNMYKQIEEALSKYGVNVRDESDQGQENGGKGRRLGANLIDKFF